MWGPLAGGGEGGLLAPLFERESGAPQLGRVLDAGRLGGEWLARVFLP